MTVRITWQRALLSLVALLAAGMLFAWSGAFNVAASSGHWRITDWFLHWTMRNSVRTRAALSTPDDVTDATGMVSAAGHFAQACASCHGAPGVRPSPVMQRATPHAPNLAVNVPQWTDRQLFWILEHGVKYTGMPAWGSKGRPDEVARMVSFLRLLPRMTPREYRQLAGLDVEPPSGVVPQAAAMLSGCIACHGDDGRGRGQSDIPVLGGQSTAYLERTLRDYASGKRASAVMGQAAASLSDGERRVAAAFFAGQAGVVQGTDVGSGAGAPIAQIIRHGRPDLQLPACASCHRPGGTAPSLGGQKASYIAARLHRWRGKDEVVDARKPQDVMSVIARRIPEGDIGPLARSLAAGVPATRRVDPSR